MKSSIAASILLIASATAIPSHHNVHHHHHAHKRDVLYVTVTKYVEATQIEYATKWVYPDGSPATITPAVQPQAAPSEAPAPEPSIAESSIPPVHAPLQSAPVPLASPSKAPQAPKIVPQAPPPAATPAPASSKAAYIPPAAPAIPEPAAAAPAPAPKVPAPAPKAPAPAPEPAPQAPNGPAPGSSGTFTGQMTYYDVGLGSCGITSSPSEHIVAIPVSQMNNPANPNANPLCGQSITIHYGGKTTTAKIVDTCMGCSHGDLDMSTSLFSSLAPMSEGRVGGMTWSFGG